MLDSIITRFKQFRDLLRSSFPRRRDATLELVDAISGNTQFKSPVALSLSALFARQYSSIHDSVDNFFSSNKK
ncbi:MAG: hypothetical protein HQM14_22035 [SAR324 cluster bacterium]|nr:hypothetical protein [SAR324 cluster bacterium]